MSKQLKFSDEYYRKLFPNLNEWSAGPFGEDPEIFGGSISEVIEEAINTRPRFFRVEALCDLRLLLSYDDAELDRATWALISFDPTIDIEELEPGWGFYPSLRAFWADVLRLLEVDLARSADTETLQNS